MIKRLITATSFVLALVSQASAQEPTPLDQIGDIATRSKCASVYWPDRGRAPKSYLRGVALVFARAVCEADRPDVQVASAAKSEEAGAARTDALTWYASRFRKLGLSNDQNGVDTLRHVYTLMLSLGMRETSGKYCVGRDRSADFDSADSAEAGLFQTSWGAHEAHETLSQLFNKYKSDQAACLLDHFRQHVKCTAWDARTWGEGAGAEWQELTKACPAFATEYAAVVVRTSGGSKGEFGPLRKYQAEIRPACDSMLSKVQSFVESNPQVCGLLRSR